MTVLGLHAAHEKGVSLGIGQVSPISGSLPENTGCRWACKELPGHPNCVHTPLLAHLLAKPGIDREPVHGKKIEKGCLGMETADCLTDASGSHRPSPDLAEIPLV